MSLIPLNRLISVTFALLNLMTIDQILLSRWQNKNQSVVSHKNIIFLTHRQMLMWKGLSLFEGDELMEGKIKCFDSKSLKKDMRRKSHNFIDSSKLRLGSGVLDLLDIDVSKVT